MINKALYSSKKEDWETPPEIYDHLNDEFKFTLDPCANEKNKKTEKYYTKEENGLAKNWEGETVFCNPPYGTKNLRQWIQKCYEEGKKENTTVVMLIPARTDTKAFHKYIYNKAEIRFIEGRIKFKGAKNPAPFPSMIVIFKKP